MREASPLAALAGVLPAIAGAAALHDRDGSVPRDSLGQLHAIGLSGLTVPKALGGFGAGLRLSAEAVEQVGMACPATALILAMHLLRHAAIARSPAWPEALRIRLARSAIDRAAWINALRVEPELGSPTRGGLPATIACAAHGGWVISGRKRYATGAPALGWLEVHARTDEASPRIGNFLVPADTPGITILETWNHLGLRGSGSHDVGLEAVWVPADHAIGLAAPGTAPADPAWAVWNTVLVGAVYQGVARAARDWLVRFLAERAPSNIGAPLATLPRVQEAVGGIEALLSVNARVLAALALASDAGQPPAAIEASALKTVLAENAVRAVEQATLLAGNHAHDRAFPLERHWRDVQCARVHAPATDAALLAAGRAALLPETTR